ncbi:ParA family protein [Mucilaginibacter achroorhodeus]|uniref:ParA family protein n=1 Tax=Mucilaginibacter achroorhodeus TaxID=2599294 RepID=A0A563UAN3_9SPHI|nr:ParA family protein [Mucilaginibacter achroorhodeus]TWR28441.1 ParA family protein [Mucilaginibacter achroorhodeus]
MKIISLFNNKGGVGKTTLAFHLSNILAEQGHKILIIDLDPQCNLTICGMDEEALHNIWLEEDSFIDDFESSMKNMSVNDFSDFLDTPKTIHFLLKPTEDGVSDLPKLPPPVPVKNNLDLIPGRLTIHKYENKISERWSGAYLGESLSIRTLTNIRTIAEQYTAIHNYDFVIIDTSPSLGALNKVIISTVDGFLIPALPDMFSLYGIRNIGGALNQWKKEFNTIYGLISEDKRNRFPTNFVRFLGYTIYNAKKYKDVTPWDLAKAHYNYAQQIPETIEAFINPDLRSHLDPELAKTPIGGKSVMHSHNTLPNMSQKYKRPIWEIPDLPNLEADDISTIKGNANTLYKPTRERYIEFAKSLLERIETLN